MCSRFEDPPYLVKNQALKTSTETKQIGIILDMKWLTIDVKSKALLALGNSHNMNVFYPVKLGRLVFRFQIF